MKRTTILANAIALTMAALPAAAASAQSTTTRPFYNERGSFAGSSATRGNCASRTATAGSRAAQSATSPPHTMTATGTTPDRSPTPSRTTQRRGND